MEPHDLMNVYFVHWNLESFSLKLRLEQFNENKVKIQFMMSVLSVVETFLSYHTLEITEKCHCMSLCLLKCLIKKYFHNNSQFELYFNYFATFT